MDVRTMVGLQSQGLPALQKVKELIAQGVVGTVLSTSMCHTESFLSSSMPESLAYVNQDEVGGTLHTIMGGHALDMIQTTLSPIREYRSLLSVQTPIITLTTDDPATQTTMPRTSPDHIYIHGRLEDSAVFSYSLRGGSAPPNSPVFNWNIHGTEGQIQITADTLLMRSFAQIRIILQKNGGDANDVKTEEDEYNRMNLGFATNTARLYAAFADGSNGGGYPDFNLAEARYETVCGTQSAGRMY